MKAIPAIDLIDNKIVRLFQGDYDQLTGYAANPLDYAKQIAAAGLDRLHLVDLSGAEKGKPVHLDILREICYSTDLKVDFGGGVKTREDVEAILNAGAEQVVIGSLCVKEPDLVVSWLKEYGIQRFILAIDTDGEFVKINGWKDSSGLRLEEVLHPFLVFEDITVLTTDIRRDGTGKGVNLELYTKLIAVFPWVKWIASGGVDSLDDLHALKALGIYGCVIGKALLEGKIKPEKLFEFNNRHDV